MIFITRGFTELANNNAVMQALNEHAKRLSKYRKCHFFLPIDTACSNSNDRTFYSSMFELMKLIICSKERDFFVSEFLSVILVKVLSPRSNITYWVQGSIPHESFMRNKSFFRFIIASILEFFGLLLSFNVIFVSQSMKNIYIKRYGKIINFKNRNTLIIPCSSRLNYFHCNKIKNSFVYLGGMDKWQSFDTICDIYLKIKEVKADASFFVVTRDIAIAKKIIEHKKIDDVSLVTVNDANELSMLLSKMEYGFLIRNNSVVNQVASPIKLGEYMSCGVTPIITTSVMSFGSALQDNNICIATPYENITGVVASLIKEHYPDPMSVLNKYHELYSDDVIENQLKVVFG